MINSKTKNLVVTALCLAMGMVLPSVFHMFGAGPMLLPMHIPVLICGMICGWQYGALCGFIVPLLSSMLTGMPPLFPVAIAMMFELSAYGCLSGLFYRLCKLNIYLSLVGAMIGGRLVSGCANTILLGMAGKPYGLQAFLSGAFVTAIPGIAIQIVAVPLLVMALQKAGLAAWPKVKAKV